MILVMTLNAKKGNKTLEKEIVIGTLASHSALNILSGAQKEGFKTLLFSKENRNEFYKSFDIADEIVNVKDYVECLDSSWNTKNLVLIPHGSFVAYLSLDKIINSSIPIFGTKKLLQWEANRVLKSKLMIESGFTVPKEYETVQEVGNKPVIVKFDGAEGGKGYFVAQNKQDLINKIAEKNLKQAKMHFQEYIVGNKVYVQFFQSPIRNTLEIFGADIRYETDVDSKIRFDDEWSFQIIGNLPVVLRESLLMEFYTMGKNFVQAVKKNLGTNMVGPFCLETIVDRNLQIYCFEFSGRIVAGTNIFVPTSPYSYITHKKKMWMGRRIALEINEALEQDRLQEVFQ